MERTRGPLRSGTVVLGSVGLLAAALTACSSEPDKRCVDRDSYDLVKGYKVVADKNCKTGTPGKTTVKTGTKKLKKQVDAAWYYEGEQKNGWVDGGSFTKPGGGSGSGGSYDDDDDDHHSGGGGVHRGGFGGGKGSSGG
ncbi:hypothetical protein [Streptomyces cyanogenus]|uniref:Lipoprotein n=1 Tax=Streptomyces cyanogenus TaxID=80860 RepID=A0ABX7TYF2_STRCY|nr:hypothetical protein [Streptomyces cyanogenus]QTE00442.1 hypothetical protein S1361_24135 [Streptomyces cyanogenus]